MLCQPGMLHVLLRRLLHKHHLVLLQGLIPAAFFPSCLSWTVQKHRQAVVHEHLPRVPNKRSTTKKTRTA